MSQNKDVEAIAQEIERHAVSAGHALADYLAQHFSDGLTEIDFKRHRIADYIVQRTTTDLLDRFHQLIADDEGSLRERAIATVKSAFEKRLAELYGDA